MDVRKLVLLIGALTLLAVGTVLYLRSEPPPSDPRHSDPTLARRVEAEHGPALRAMGVSSLGVDPRTDDVVVVFSRGGRLGVGRRVAGRLPGLAGAEGCGKLDVGISIDGGALTAWGDASTPSFYARLDCVIDEVIERAADLREPE